MGKGIALQFKAFFPYNFEVYRKACASGELKVGGVLVVNDHNMLLGDRTIINFPTKTHWRLPSEYTFIEQGLSALAEFIVAERLTEIALPALGCGNGGLDWKIVRPIIVSYLEKIDAHIEIYEPAI
jgi:O-acetyl-ADP-ribose deacetylase (regulator of RNase III)